MSPTAATAPAETDRKLEALARRKKDWLQVPLARRGDYLRSAIDGLLDVADEWVVRACAAKGERADSPVAGEEWVSGPMVTVRYLRLLAEALESGGQPEPGQWRETASGQRVARVFPRGFYDRLPYPGIDAEVWIEPNKPASQGRVYSATRAENGVPGRVGLVLGAGNVGSIVPTDLLYKVFVEDQVALVKMNPVNEYLGPLLASAFGALVDDGFLDFVYGDARLGGHLCQHPLVEAIHLTGSEQTFEAIVWGGDVAERARRKRSGRPLVDKPVSAELGCVTPVIVVPGRWSLEEMRYQARHVASMVAHNASFNCNAAKVLLLCSSWYLKQAFVDAVAEALAEIAPRRAYYPGAVARYRTFLEHYPTAQALGQRADGVVPWTLIRSVPAQPGEYALQTEAFCGVLAEVALDAGGSADPQAFLDAAVEFVNQNVRGTLSCALLACSETQEQLRDGLEQALTALRYGAIGVNVWPGVVFGLGVTSWGAFPGHRIEEIGSGLGVVHNALLFDHPQRSVVRAPFRMPFTPPWFADHRNLIALGRKITQFEADPSLRQLPGLLGSALLG
ncbi:MAG: aldehyde dehydrogenase [Acidobacteriota bacterium]|nr:MAG: aldehyde dehydrogenase [Acidobacteriota bacterium]